MTQDLLTPSEYRDLYPGQDRSFLEAVLMNERAREILRVEACSCVRREIKRSGGAWGGVETLDLTEVTAEDLSRERPPEKVGQALEALIVDTGEDSLTLDGDESLTVQVSLSSDDPNRLQLSGEEVCLVRFTPDQVENNISMWVKGLEAPSQEE